MQVNLPSFLLQILFLYTSYTQISEYIYSIITGGSLTHSRKILSCLSESCFRLSLAHRKPPLFCQQGYLKRQGVARDSRLWQRDQDGGPMPTVRDEGTSAADPAFPAHLAQAGASISAGLKLDF